MRPCPICDHTGKRVIMDNYCGTSMINAEVTKVCLFECTQCGHRYIDGLHLSQEWFDDYYLNRYRTDDKPYSDERLASLATCLREYGVASVLDIGGMDGELIKVIHETSAIVAAPVGVMGETRGKWEAVVLSHTLEHIYDMPVMFERIKAALHPDGLLFVEVPVHLGYKEPTAYDNHWQHIQKFRPEDLTRLFGHYRFTVQDSHQLPDYREYNVWRIVGRYV